MVEETLASSQAKRSLPNKLDETLAPIAWMRKAGTENMSVRLAAISARHQPYGRKGKR
jgi:hypothetical protein